VESAFLGEPGGTGLERGAAGEHGAPAWDRREVAPTVYLARLEDETGIGRGVERCLGWLDQGLELADRKVFLKVNLMKGAPPGKAWNTHPEVVRAVIRWVRSRGGEPRFGDSCGVPGHTMAAARSAGYLALASEEGVPFVDLDSGDFVQLDSSDPGLGRFWVPKAVLDAEVRITLPKLKTHTLTGLTGALKNQMGLLPGGTKAALHVRSRNVEGLARAIVEINRKVPFHLAVMDGGIALEGGGSRKGRPRWLGCVLAGTDLLAVDMGACRLMGWDPSDIPTNRAAREMGLGPASLDVLRWEGDPLPEGTAPFRRPPKDPKLHPWISRFIYRLRERSFRPEHDPGVCRDCGECERVCPTGAVTRRPGSWIRWEDCIRCLACTNRCPEGALPLRGLWYLGPFLRSRMGGGEEV